MSTNTSYSGSVSLRSPLCNSTLPRTGKAICMLPLSKEQFDNLWESFCPHPSVLRNDQIQFTVPVDAAGHFLALAAIEVSLNVSTQNNCFARTALVKEVRDEVCNLLWSDDDSTECISVDRAIALNYKTSASWKSRKSWQPLDSGHQPICTVTFIDLYNWAHSEGLMSDQRSPGHIRDQVWETFQSRFGGQRLPAHLLERVQEEFCTRILPCILVPLSMELARQIRTTVSAQAQLPEQAWRLSGVPGNAEWSSRDRVESAMAAIQKQAMALQKEQCHWWMLYCPATDGKLRCSASRRHKQRLEELLPKVCRVFVAVFVRALCPCCWRNH